MTPVIVSKGRSIKEHHSHSRFDDDTHEKNVGATSGQRMSPVWSKFTEF